MFPVKRRQLFRNMVKNWYLSSDTSYYASIRDIAFKQYMTTRGQDDWRNICKARNKAKAVVPKIKSVAHLSLFEDIRSSKELWSVLKSNGYSSYKSYDYTENVNDLN